MKTENNYKRVRTGWMDKLEIYIEVMNHSQSIRGNYQSLLTSLETAIYGFVFYLYQLNLTDNIWILAIPGIIFCIIFGIACEFHASIVDTFRTYIAELVEGTDIEDVFRDAKGWMFPHKFKFVRRFRGQLHWFEKIVVPIMLIGWLFVLLLLHSPPFIFLLGVVAVFGHIMYLYYFSGKLRWVYYKEK